MAGNFNVQFKGSGATNVEHYDYTQSNLTHTATGASMSTTGAEIDYGEVDSFDYENYLAENQSSQVTVQEPQIVITEEMIEEVRQELRNCGFIDKDIERLLKGEITLEDLYKEIENDTDGTRRRKIYESSYLMSLGSEFTNIEDLEADINKTKREIQAKRELQYEFDFTEEEAAYGLLVALLMYGGDIDEIAETYIVGWSYEDENGVTRYEYSYNPYFPGGYYGATPIYYNDVYKDSKYLEEIRSSLVEVEKTRGILWWQENYTAYEWEWTEEQTALYDRIEAQKDKAMAARENKIAEYQAQIDELTTRQLQEEAILNYVNQELDHYMENVDTYIHQPNFMDKCGMNEELRERASEISTSTTGELYYTSDGMAATRYVGKEDGMAVIAAIINKTGDFTCSSGFIFSSGSYVQISISDATLKNYDSWIPFMQADEIEVFNYIYNTEGAEAAYDYLVKISDELDNRWLMDTQQKDAEWAKEHPVLASIGSVFITPFEGMNAAFVSLGSVITGNEIRRVEVYSMGDTFRQAVSQDIYENYGEGWAFLYNTGMSMADSITLIAACYATGGLMGAAGVTSTAATTIANTTISATLMGSRAYVSTLNDALNRGLSDDKAVLLAFSSATVETLMESCSVGHLINLEGALGDASANMVRRLTANISNPTLQKIAINSGYLALGVISQGLCEGEEELCTEILNHYIDEMMAGELSNYNLSIYNHMLEGMGEEEARRLANEEYHDQIKQAFAGGFLSGGIFGAGRIGVSEFNVSRAVSRAINTEYKVAGLTTLEQTQRNQIIASILGIDSRYQTACINALAGNLTQEQISKMNIGTLFAIKDAVNNYQRYDSSVTLESIFKNVSETNIGNNIETVNDYQAPSLKDIFNKLVGKQNANTNTNANTGTYDFISNLPLTAKQQQTIMNLLIQYEQMPTIQNETLAVSAAMRLIDQSFAIPDQKNIGKQYTRAAYFYLLANGYSVQDASKIVSSYAKARLDATTSFNIRYNSTYGFKINFSTKMDVAMQNQLLTQFENNFSLLPEILQQQIKEVNFYDTYNPADIYWELNYNTNNFNSAATGGSGIINLWTGIPTLELLAHEAAHCYDTACAASWGLTNGQISTSTLWQNAMQSDFQISGKEGVSSYAIDSKSPLEDFADSVSLYLTNQAALDAFPNRKKLLLQYFKSNRLTQLSLDINTISQMISDKYGYKFQDVLVGYYVYGAHIDSELEQLLSKYTANEMYAIVGFKSLLAKSKMYTYSDYYQIIPQAIDNLVKKYGLTNAIKIMSDYLYTGKETLLTRDDGIRFDITKFGIEGFRNYVSNSSDGSLNVHKLFSKYYLQNELNMIMDIAQEKYGSQSFEQIIYEHFIYGAQLDESLANYVDKYTVSDFLSVLNLQELNNTATMYSLEHYKQSFETAMDTLIQKYGLNQAVKIFEEYLKTGDKFLLTRDNNVRFEISKFTMENLNSYLQGMYNGKSIQTIFSDYLISKDITNIQNEIVKTYGASANIQLLLYNYYVHGANLESNITNILTKYTALELSNIFGINLTDTFSEYTDADYESAIVLAFKTLIDKYGFKDATKIMEDYLNTGDIFVLTRDNNVRYEIGKFDLEDFKNYIFSNNMTLLILQNIDIQKIDTSLLDLSSLTTEQIQQYLGQFVSQDVNQGIQVDDSNFKKFKNKASLAAFFGDVPSNVRGRLKNNIESSTPLTLLEFRNTLTLAEQKEFDNYLKNTVEGRWLSTLTSQEIYAINLYTKSNYMQINAELRTKNVSSYYYNIIQSIDSALAKFTLVEDTILWRGVQIGAFNHLGIHDYAGLQALIGQTYIDLGYMSTSPSYDCSFAKYQSYEVVFKIKAPAGTTGAYVNQLSDFYNTENEFLLGRGQELMIENVSKQNIDGVEKIVIDAIVVNNTAADLSTMTANSTVTNTNVVNNSVQQSTVSVDPDLQALSEFEQSMLFGYTITGAENAVSPGTLVNVFEELNITSTMIPLNILNAIALNSNILVDVLNEQIDISGYNRQELKSAVEYYITSSLKLMEQNGLFDYELIDSVLSSDMSSFITEDFMKQMLEKSLQHYPFETYTTLLTYLGNLDSDSKYYYLLNLTGLELDSDIKTELIEKLFEDKDLRECVYEHAYQELQSSMKNTFEITDVTVVENLLNALIGSKDAFVNEGINNHELNWQHFVELLSPYIKGKVAIYDLSKPPVLWSKVDCSQLNTQFTTIENSTIGEGLYFLDLVFANWNSNSFSTPQLETLWNLLSEEFARDLCQMKTADGKTIDSLKFIFPGVEDIGGPFGNIFKNVEFAEILKNQNIKTLTLEAVLSDDVFTSKYSSVTIDLDYFRQLIANYGSTYSYEVAFEEFKGLVAAKFLNENFTYFDTTDTITALMNNITTGKNKIAFTVFKNNLTEDIFNILF